MDQNEELLKWHWNFFQVGGAAGGGQDMATTMLQKFWDSALALEPAEDESDSRRQARATLFTWLPCCILMLVMHSSSQITIMKFVLLIAVIYLHDSLTSFRKDSPIIHHLGLAILSLSN